MEQGKNAALIGAGRMGMAHAAALAEEGVSIVAVCERREEGRANAATELGLPPSALFDDANKLFEAGLALDVVVIATTADSHRDLVLAAARAKIPHVLCEKPMATSVADCDAMLEACKAAGTRLAINHQMRFMDQYTRVLPLLGEGGLGRFASMNVVAGNFGLAMNGTHYVEAFRVISGVEPAEVAARFSPGMLANPRGPQFQDQAGELRVVGSDGSRLSMDVSTGHGHGMTVTYAGEWGHLFVDELEGELIATTRLPEHRAQPTTRYGMPWARVTERFAQADNVQPTRAVLNALLAGENYPDGNDGRRAVAVMAAAARSDAEQHRYVSLDDLGTYYERQFAWA